MPVVVLFGLFTLTPLGAGILLGAVGLVPAARRLPRIAPLIVAILGALIPMAGLVALAPDVIPELPLQLTFLTNPHLAPTAPFAPVYRVDTFGMYCAFGIAFLVAPLLLWVSWRAAPEDETETQANGEPEAPVHVRWYAQPLRRWAWLGLALTLALESAALTLCFADNIGWLILAWLVLILCAWGLGELSSELRAIDWIGLGAMALGPVAWGVLILWVTIPAKQWRLLDLTGSGGFGLGQVIALGVALACAGGAYPFLAWLRRRASFAMPAGVAAVSVAVVPAMLLVGARTYSALRDTSDSWPRFSVGVPPITAGIAMTLLGAVSIFLAGLLALGRRDGRALVAFLTLAQSGWGLIALGVGQPISLLGLMLLLASSIAGLGAILAALVAGGALTAEVEPESAGPRILGERLHAPTLFAWGIGVASLLGTPLLVGFAAQETITAASLPSTKLAIPLIGLAWAGDALLAIALIRATALAFTQSPKELQAAQGDNEAENEDEEEDEETLDEAPARSGKPARRELPGLPELHGDDLPGVILALLVIVLGIAPEWLLSLGGVAGASELSQPDALIGLTQTTTTGYSFITGGQWLPGVAIWAAVIVFAVIVLLRARSMRAVRPVYLAGQAQNKLLAAFAELAELETNPAKIALLEAKDPAHLDDLEDLDAIDHQIGIAEPHEAWSELLPVFTSGFATPGAGWIDIDNPDEEEEGELDESAQPEGEAVETSATQSKAGKAKALVPVSTSGATIASPKTPATSASSSGKAAKTPAAQPSASTPGKAQQSTGATSPAATKPTAPLRGSGVAVTKPQPAATKTPTLGKAVTPTARAPKPTAQPSVTQPALPAKAGSSAGKQPASAPQTSGKAGAAQRQPGAHVPQGSPRKQGQPQGQHPPQGSQQRPRQGQSQRQGQGQGQKSKKASSQRGGKRA